MPFGAYLISSIKPRLLVELGTHTGFSYCTFCEAVKQLKTGTTCYAVDTWQGDVHAGWYGHEVLAELQAYHEPRYGEFSRLLQSSFDEALAHFVDGTIDLLHIDGCHTYEAVKRDFEAWLPKMSSQGVILFHDTEVRERDFGVWQLWEELKSQYPHFEFLHGHGLGVLAVSHDYPRALKDLFEASDEEAAVIRDFFYRLGSGITTQYYSQKKEQDWLSLSAQLAEQEQAVRASLAQAAIENTKLQEWQTQFAEKEQQLASLQAVLADRDRELAKITSSLGWKLKNRLQGLYFLIPYRIRVGITGGVRWLIEGRATIAEAATPAWIHPAPPLQPADLIPESQSLAEPLLVAPPAVPGAVKHHQIISGTGRAGTTFLVQLLTALKLDTGFQDIDSHIFQDSQAGMEWDIRSPDAPYIVKSPWLADYLLEVLAAGTCVIDHAFVPVRDLYAAAASRARVTAVRDLGLYPEPQSAPGGLWHTDDPTKQSDVLTGQLYKLIHALVKYDVPHTFLYFPQIIHEPDYLYHKLTPVLDGLNYETFLSAFHEVAKPELVHTFDQAGNEPQLEAQP
jgi:hypothetical protein